jgi:hypothetical protein
VYAAELDDRPLEVQRGAAVNQLIFWPKLPGFGNVQVEEDTIPTFSIYKPDGTLIAGPLNTTVLPILDPVTVETVYSAIAMMVDASDQEIYQLLPDYRIDLLWRPELQPGMILAQLPIPASLRFSCVREPYVPQLSLNDFQEEFADARQFIEGQALALADERTADQHASVLGVRAWKEIYIKLQKRLRAEKRIYPRLIIDRFKIENVVIAQAMHCLFRAEAGNEHARELAKEWKEEADLRFSDLGELPYDENDDGAEDVVVRAPVSRRLQRRWG